MVGRVPRHPQVADVKDVVVAGPGRLLAHVITVVLVELADVTVQIQ